MNASTPLTSSAAAGAITVSTASAVTTRSNEEIADDEELIKRVTQRIFQAVEARYNSLLVDNKSGKDRFFESPASINFYLGARRAQTNINFAEFWDLLQISSMVDDKLAAVFQTFLRNLSKEIDKKVEQMVANSSTNWNYGFSIHETNLYTYDPITRKESKQMIAKVGSFSVIFWNKQTVTVNRLGFFERKLAWFGYKKVQPKIQTKPAPANGTVECKKDSWTYSRRLWSTLDQDKPCAWSYTQVSHIPDWKGGYSDALSLFDLVTPSDLRQKEKKMMEIWENNAQKNWDYESIT